MTVESDIGDICPPAIAPESIDPRIGYNNGIDSSAKGVDPGVYAITIGIDKGIMIITVPQADPVDEAIAVDVRNIVNASIYEGIILSNRCAKYSPVCRSDLSMVLNVHASSNTIYEFFMSKKPSIKTSCRPEIVNFF